MMSFKLFLWVHIVSMVSVIGVLLSAQVCMRADDRNGAESSRTVARLANILLGVGFLAGIAYYLLNKGYAMGPHYNGVVGVKFVFLLGAGALLGISKRTDRGDGLRWISLTLLLLASLFGITL